MELDLTSLAAFKKLRQRQKFKLFINYFLFWGASLLIFIFIVISLVNFVFNWQIKNLVIKNEDLKKEIESFAKLENQQVYLNSKLTAFAQIIKGQEQHQAVAETIFSFLPNGTSLKGFELKESDHINLAGSVPSWQLFFQLLRNLNQSTVKPLQLDHYQINKVNFNNNDNISFELEIWLKL